MKKMMLAIGIGLIGIPTLSSIVYSSCSASTTDCISTLKSKLKKKESLYRYIRLAFLLV